MPRHLTSSTPALCTISKFDTVTFKFQEKNLGIENTVFFSLQSWKFTVVLYFDAPKICSYMVSDLIDYIKMTYENM